MNFSNFRSNRSKAFSAVFVAAALIGLSPVQAEDVVKTRAQVNAELADAVRNGDVADATTGIALNQLYPGSFPANAHVAGKTREQVQSELAEAIRSGDIADATLGTKLNALYPGSYPKSGIERVVSK